MERCIVRVLLWALLATLSSIPDRAQEHAQLPGSTAAVGQISVQFSPDSLILVAVDAPREALVIYRIVGDSVRLIDVRRLERDIVEGVAKTPSATTSPTAISADVPGQDPPNFIRPSGAVRISSDYDANTGGGAANWNASYAVKGALDDVYKNLRKTYKDWKLLTERTGDNRAMLFTASNNDNRTMRFELTAWKAAPGFVKVEVSEDRRRD